MSASPYRVSRSSSHWRRPKLSIAASVPSRRMNSTWWPCSSSASMASISRLKRSRLVVFSRRCTQKRRKEPSPICGNLSSTWFLSLPAIACSRASTTELPTTSMAAGAKPSSTRNSRLSSTGAACRSDPASATRLLNFSGEGSLLPLDQLPRSIDCSRNDAHSSSAPCSSQPRSTSGHGGRGVAVHVGDREAAPLREAAQVRRELGRDARDQVVDAPAHLEVDVLAHPELVEHRLGQVVVVVLTGVAQHHVVPACAQLVVDRRLLDDVGLGADDDDVLAVLGRHGFLRVGARSTRGVRGDLRGCWRRGANAAAPASGCPAPSACPGRRRR